MKKICSTFIALIATVFLLTAQDFEGIITYKNDALEGAIPVIMVKDNLVRLELNTEGKNMVMITNKDDDKMTILMDNNGQKIALIQDTKQMDMMAAQMAAGKDGADKDDFEITVTGETKMIDGYKCTKILGKNEEMEGTAWVCKDLDINFVDLFPTLRQSDPMHSTLLDEGFVMEYTAKNLKTGEVVKMTADVDEKSLSADKFIVPEDYMVMDMTNMAELMKEAQKDPEKMKQLQQMMQENK